MQLIPALDLAGGGVVRLEQGDFARARRYAEPAELWLERFAAAGARTAHVVDLDAARDGDSANGAAVAGLLGRGVDLQVAGGIRSRACAIGWLARGAARVVVGSAAVERPDEVAGWIGEFGAERVVLAFDLRRGADGGRRVATRGWRTASEWTLETAVGCFRAAGLRHALVTAIERDGRLEGPDLALCAAARAAAPSVGWQASGGVRDAADLAALAAAGVAAAVVGRALLDGRLPLSEIARWSRNGSFPAST